MDELIIKKQKILFSVDNEGRHYDLVEMSIGFKLPSTTISYYIVVIDDIRILGWSVATSGAPTLTSFATYVDGLRR